MADEPLSEVGKCLPLTKRPIHGSSAPEIIDIRRDKVGRSLLEDIKSGLRPAGGGEKSLPTLLLYDELGLRLFEDITYLDEYYLTEAEIDVLKTHGRRIAERIPDGSIVLELGSGNLRKIKILLQALEDAGKAIDYYALDVSKDELERTLRAVPNGMYKHVRCYGLHATYDDGLEWLRSLNVRQRTKSVLWMGSSIGNFTRDEAPKFLEGFASALMPGDTLLIGIDACKDPEKVYHAYNDREGLTHRFLKNGLKHANRLLGSKQFDLNHWSGNGEYEIATGRHHAFMTPDIDVTIDGILIRKGERVWIEESNKWSSDETAWLWDAAGLAEGAKWCNSTGDYALHMAYKPSFNYPLRPEQYAAQPVPSLEEWKQLWAAWDTVTLHMIPKEELLDKPIKLRNACIFYLGHIPTFLDMHLTRSTKGAATEPAYYPQIFERGIDPDVNDPSLCHAHSEVPDEWPPAAEIVDFQKRVRERTRALYASGTVETDHAVRKAMWIGFEHEIMHLETLLYMLVQSEKTLPPIGSVKPDFDAMAAEASIKATENQWFKIPARTITLGMDDDDADTVTKRFFGWDNEKPPRIAGVAAFVAKARPITNGEYAEYMEREAIQKIPASWAEGPANGNHINGYSNSHMNEYHANSINHRRFFDGKTVRTVFGPVPLKLALDWPVMASFDELAGCATWMGGRIPTMEEVRSIYEYVEELKAKGFENALQKTIPAVNSHLVNDGVEETPPPNDYLNGSSSNGANPSPSTLFVNLEGANVGFKHWHPVPVTPNGNKLSGQGDLGGVWEWTSTVLEKHAGFEPMALYPAYTADFFDGKHNVVLGGSWATHPRIAGRKSFVNWYQRNYPYVWAGARLVKDF